MKLLITLDFPPGIGGIQRYLYNIVRFYYIENDSVFVAGIQPESGKHHEIKAKVKHFSLPFYFFNRKIALLLLIFPYISLCRRSRGNLTVECGNLYAAFIPWMLFSITHQSYHIYTHGTELIASYKKSLKGFIYRKILLKAEKLYSNSSYSEKLLKKLKMFQSIEVVPPRIVLPAQAGGFKQARGDKFTALCVGRLVKYKGHANYIKAADILSKERNCRFVLIGNGPQYNVLSKMRKKLALEECLSIKRNLSNEYLDKEFMEADIFVFPSLETHNGTEGFGIALLEAMAFNLPIVASASGGIPEVLDNGNCALLIEPNNVEALVSGISYIADNPSFAEDIAKKAYKRLLTHYVWK